MSSQQAYLDLILKALDDIQAADVTVINVKEQTSITDYMIVCTGRSSRHVKAIADTVMEELKPKGLSVISQSGVDSGDWALIDFGDFVIHIMQADSRAFYNIEGLWQTS